MITGTETWALKSERYVPGSPILKTPVHSHRTTPAFRQGDHVPAAFIECVDWTRGWHVREITTGHDAMVTGPPGSGRNDGHRPHR